MFNVTIICCNFIIKDQLKQQQIHERVGAGIKKALPYVGRALLESYIYL